jgi:hypothetical protein
MIQAHMILDTSDISLNLDSSLVVVFEQNLGFGPQENGGILSTVSFTGFSVSYQYSLLYVQ